MKFLIISEDSIPTMYRALCFWNNIYTAIFRSQDTKAQDLIQSIEEEFLQIIKKGK